ncbi:NUDIX hydrolase [Cytobacillus sp. FSL K6-0265]|uniref:NUDIX hydrolase n=1 Tax=Cytobacillus sp. FSL K6-0265 TaxID=2921448 RepID=UPI0030F91CBF
MNRVDVAYSMIVDENEENILMVKNSKHNNWSPPGGGIEKGETLLEAAIREAKEETGLDIEVGDIVAINEAFMEKENFHAIFFTFKAKIIGGEIEINDTETIEEVRWMSIAEAESWMPYHQKGIRYLLKQSALYYFEEN